MAQSIADRALRGKIVGLLITGLLDDLLRVKFLSTFVIFSNIDVGHVDGSFALVEDEDISVDVFDAVVVNFDVDSEEGAKEGQQFVSGDEVIQRFCFIHEDHESSEEVHHDDVHDRIFVDSLEDCVLARAQLTEELHDEGLGLVIVENVGVVLLVKNELEGGVVDELLDLVNQLLRFLVVYLEAEFQVLVVEHFDMGLRVVRENFHHSRGVHQVMLEEIWKTLRVFENFLSLHKLSQRSHF